MVAKHKKGASVQVEYLIHIQDIKPWPPSQSLRTLRSVLIQWENGERKSGSTNTVVPSIGSIVGEGKIEFDESFRLSATLMREMSSKGKDSDSFQKNCLEFNLCEPRRDKMQILGTALIDLADYGVVKETIVECSSETGALGTRLSYFCILNSSQLIRVEPTPHQGMAYQKAFCRTRMVVNQFQH